jgi:HAD superfamily hydrolase (TIGR01509 family)
MVHRRGMRPRVVCFDFDGVLVDTEWAIYEAWQRTFAEHGQELPLSLYVKCIGTDFDAWSPKLYLEDLTKLEFDWIEKDRLRQVEIRAALKEQGPMEGVVELLEWMRSAGIRLAVVSSSSHGWVDGWLERLDLAQYFEEVVCKGDAARIKPAPDLYEKAAEKMGVDVRDCLVIEDSLNGLIAGKGAGMRVWVVPNRVTSGLDFVGAERVFEGFGEVVEAFRDL